MEAEAQPGDSQRRQVCPTLDHPLSELLRNGEEERKAACSRSDSWLVVN